VLIEALAGANAPISGDYHLVITKTGANGSSDIEQGGPFEAAAGRSITLGLAELGLDRGDRFHAVLTTADEKGGQCREERRS
jgi:hypothetical protein